MKKLSTTLLAVAIASVAFLTACDNSEPEPTRVSGVTLNPTSATLFHGDTLRLTAIVHPNEAHNQNINWLSTDMGVVNVSNGFITAMSPGIVNVVVTTQDGGHTATSTITVTPPFIPVLNITNIPATANLGMPRAIVGTVVPSNATNQTIVWNLVDPGSTDASMNENILNATIAGNVIIRATVENGATRTTDFTQDFTISIVPDNIPNNCGQYPPRWGNSLGTISFDSRGHNALIEGNGVAQIWSGAVTATACQKNIFHGGGWNPLRFYTDCRSAGTGWPGDLFSWCAVVRFADVLCPYPWRVPTRQDFINLDVAMGGSGDRREGDLDFVNTNYMTRWGGAMAGRSDNVGSRGLIGTGFYWTQSEAWEVTGYTLAFSNIGTIDPHLRQNKLYGQSLRCIRDVE